MSYHQKTNRLGSKKGNAELKAMTDRDEKARIVGEFTPCARCGLKYRVVDYRGGCLLAQLPSCGDNGELPETCRGRQG